MRLIALCQTVIAPEAAKKCVEAFQEDEYSLGKTNDGALVTCGREPPSTVEMNLSDPERLSTWLSATR